MNRLTPDAAGRLAERYWNLRGDIHVLPSYRDQNFRIRGAAGEHVLKIAHPSWARADLDLENRAMMALATNEPDVEWPRVRFTPSGEHLLTVPIDGQPCHARVLGFVPGATWAAVIGDLPAAQRGRLHESLGTTVARLTRGLEGFEHPAAAREHPWNLLQLPRLQDEVARIADAGLRAAVAAAMNAFCARLDHWRECLPMTVVHNDANDHNVLVDRQADGPWRVRSIIDFGDLCTSFRVANLAIACTYAMQHEADPVACARRILHGYLRCHALSREERGSLHAFILARICQSILMATRAHEEQPDNSYILVSQQGLQALLYTLIDVEPGAIAEPLPESRHE